MDSTEQGGGGGPQQESSLRRTKDAGARSKAGGVGQDKGPGPCTQACPATDWLSALGLVSSFLETLEFLYAN